MMRIALVHDWLTGMRGGEKALEVLCESHPDAELFTLVAAPGTVSPAIARLKRHTSLVQRLPLARRFYRQYLPLFPTAVELFDLDGFDLVVSTSHCAAKSVIVPNRARHICYCFTPMRYAWDQFDHYFGRERLGSVGQAAARLTMSHLARWDAATAGRVGRYVAISRYVASRIRRYYNRQAVVVYPPVDTRFYHPDGRAPESYFLIVSALVPYKRIDVAIEAARLAGAELRIVGDGPDRRRLEAAAGPSVTFLGARSNEEIRDLYRGAAAVLLPGIEDFGIAPVEAQACGRPVVALAEGGALETVVPGETGMLVPEPGPEALAEGMRAAAGRPFDPAVIRAHAERFGRERFAREIAAVMDDTLASPGGAAW
jgi:glycosyltransferase involved in cell wall biosynthesis